jgi:D-alanyl-D-alanine carboxypeptidase/D-alanyl-D-alanine-endopeptidase (penicillin-binding protein 4)
VRTLLLLLLVAPAPRPEPALSRVIDSVVNAPGFETAFWGIEIRDLSTGAVLYKRNARSDFRPASTLKLVSTAAALDVLGKDDRPATTLETSAPVSADGILEGDLFLVGRGDPGLSERVPPEAPLSPFDELAEGLLKAGIRGVAGRLVGHEGLFKGPRRGAGWGWEDLVWWYGAEVSALSFSDNCAHLTVSPGSHPGDPVHVETSPLTAYYRVESVATTSTPGTKSDLMVRRELGENTIHLSGTQSQGESPVDLNVALEDPSLYATTAFRETLQGHGISVQGIATSQEALPTGTRVLATHQGAPLSEAIRTINKRSQNLHAEMLLRLMGFRAKGEGSVEAGLLVLQEFLNRQGVSSEDWDVEDGSGLSSYDLVTPHGLVDLLVAMARHPQADVFKASLPIAGKDGSLRNRMKGSPAEGHVFAKTGSVSHVAALAGYVDRPDGRRLAIAILANNASAKARDLSSAIDLICARLVAAP